MTTTLDGKVVVTPFLLHHARRGGAPTTIRKTKGPDLRPNLVNRDFKASDPRRLLVADITDVRARMGFVYTAFVADLFSRRIVGWALSDSMRTESLALQSLNQAIVGAKETFGLIYHADHGSQYVSIVYNERLAAGGIAAAQGTVGAFYDNALAANVTGFYKNDLIYTRTWADVFDVGIAIFERVNWWNDSRLHQTLGYRTPAEVESELWKSSSAQEILANMANT